jgi:hypothetical protein
MATLTWSLIGSAIVSSGSASFTIDDTDLQTLLNWAQATYYPPITKTSTASLTNSVLLGTWMSNLISGVSAQVLSYNQSIAAAAAAAQASGITISPVAVPSSGAAV